MRAWALLLLLIPAACTSGPLAPNCDRKTGPIMDPIAGTVPAGGTVSYELAPSLDAGWRIMVTWSNPNTNLGLKGTVLACSQLVGCQVGATFTAASTQPMIRELKLDGRVGIRYRFDVLGDPAVAQSFTFSGNYDTGVCT